ncbi:3'-5' exoribonuclease [Spirulina major CS-329]|uniref:3'-5' exoribonuclease domain-containing protein n=1 Tax=Spirulina TaxID=1154 RepID=UPI0023305D72|nr:MULTISPECIES: 3'-5' exoribonuclease [Spirulina]MDB9494729.1 3'-5' exoribonuclease [Spirulina subsalsa CS-330]MDB9503401.1 3'-5' exoribonuclease [Spirulina major CS-329]
MLIFLDTEFTGLHQQTTLISLGLVADCDRTFYAEFNDYDPHQLNPWLEANVMPHLSFSDCERHIPTLGDRHHRMKSDRATIAQTLRTWFAQFHRIELWADCPAYDWVLFCELFGGSQQLPPGLHYNPYDLATLFHCAGLDATCDRAQFAGLSTLTLHNALDDAKLAQACYHKLQSRRIYPQKIDTGGK